MQFTRLAALAVAGALLAGCTFMDKAPDFSGLTDHQGKQVSHYNQTRVALNLLFNMQPIWGDATLPTSVAHMTAEARADGAKSMRLVQSDETLLWWVFPPFSFVLTPVYSNVAGDAQMN